MSVYLELFHGRKTVDEDMNDWGEHGPMLGPVPFVHETYQCDIKFGDDFESLTIVAGTVYCEGMYYGDWSTMDEATYQQGVREGSLPKAQLPRRWGDHTNSPPALDSLKMAELAVKQYFDKHPELKTMFCTDGVDQPVVIDNRHPGFVSHGVQSFRTQVAVPNIDSVPKRS